jgi:hypothetical protein
MVTKRGSQGGTSGTPGFLLGTGIWIVQIS